MDEINGTYTPPVAMAVGTLDEVTLGGGSTSFDDKAGYQKY